MGDKIYGDNFAGFSSSADSGGSQRTGKCMYIKARRNKKISLTAQDSVVVEGGDAPCFAVCALVCDLSPKAECVPAFTRENKRGAFV